MIEEITLRDIGVIDEAVLSLGPGLTVLTGETGAGKTMVVTGLGLLLGARGDSGLVRDGAERAVVEGRMLLTPGSTAERLAGEAGAQVEDDELLVARSVSSDGRSRAHLGGRSVPIATLGSLAEHLVAVHGQADQWRLRDPDEHREVVDSYGGPPIAAALTAYRSAHAGARAARAELDELIAAQATRAQEAETLRTGLEHIEALDPKPGEDDDLRAEAQRLGHLDELRTAAAAALVALAGADETGVDGDPGAVGRLAGARAGLEQAGESDPQLADLGKRFAEVGYLAADLATDVRTYLADIDAQPQRLAQVQARRSELGELTRRYGGSVDEVLAWSRDAAARLATLDSSDDLIVTLGERVETLERERDRAAGALTARRTAAANQLGARITAELEHLAMSSAQVTIAVTDSGRYTDTGRDVVEIRMASGSSTKPRPVTKAASGGELSRVMLAIEVATAAMGPKVPTFVFDEVDAGVGGRAALDIGSRLAALAEHSQVIVVTHLAQVAAYADRHLVVERSDDGHITRSGVHRVTGEQRLAELARMLGGIDSAAALEHARDLVARAST